MPFFVTFFLPNEDIGRADSYWFDQQSNTRCLHCNLPTVFASFDLRRFFGSKFWRTTRLLSTAMRLQSNYVFSFAMQMDLIAEINYLLYLPQSISLFSLVSMFVCRTHTAQALVFFSLCFQGKLKRRREVMNAIFKPFRLSFSLFSALGWHAST